MAEARLRLFGGGDSLGELTALLRLYAARGYREVGRHRWEGKTYESVVMAKELASVDGRAG